MEVCADNPPAVTPQAQEVTAHPAEAANLPMAVERPDHGLRRAATLLRQAVGKLPSVREAWKEAETVDGKAGIFLCHELTFRPGFDGWHVTAQGLEVVMYYQDDGAFCGDDSWPGTLNLGFVGHEEFSESWYDRICKVARQELGRHYEVAAAERFEIAVPC